MRSLMKDDIYCFINAKPLSSELYRELIVFGIPQNTHTNNKKSREDKNADNDWNVAMLKLIIICFYMIKIVNM